MTDHKKSQYKTALESFTQITNEDGELLGTSLVKHSYIANSKESFFIGYSTMLSLFADIAGPSIKVYAFLLQHYAPGTMIAINKGLKQDIMKWIKCTGESTVSNALTELVRENLLYKREDIKGVYYLNPRYAFKGSTKDRNESLKAIIELGCKDC